MVRSLARLILPVLALASPAPAGSMIGADVVIDRPYWRGTPQDERFPGDAPYVFESFRAVVGPGDELNDTTHIHFDIDVDADTITMRGTRSVGYADATSLSGLNAVRLTFQGPGTPTIVGASVTSENLAGFEPDDLHLVGNAVVVGLDGATLTPETVIEIGLTLTPPVDVRFLTDPVAWDDAVDQTAVEDYEGLTNGFYSDTFMDTLYGETSYTNYVWSEGQHQLFQGTYNASNTSFTLDFDTHSLQSGGGVLAVLFEYACFSTDWFAIVRFTDGRYTIYQLPLYDDVFDPGHLGIVSDTPIERIDVCDGTHPASSGDSVFFLHTLTVGALAPAPACPGDITGDGATDIFDFAVLADFFGAGPGATRDQGDLTGDGLVNTFDFAELADDFGCAP